MIETIDSTLYRYRYNILYLDTETHLYVLEVYDDIRIFRFKEAQNEGVLTRD